MVSKTNIRNYKSRKYASRLKNKNKKRSNMRGGSNVAIKQNNENGFTLAKKSRKTLHHNKQEEITKKHKIIEDKHKCSKLTFLSNKNGNSIYECKTITPYFLYENDVKIYVDNVTPEHTFAVHEYSNQSMNIQYVNTTTGLQKTFNIRLIDLNVDTMQLALNTGSLDVITGYSDDVYIGFKNFNCLSVNTLSNPFVYTSRNKAAWFDVYEDDTTFSPDKNVFDIINLDGKYMLLQQFLELEEEQSKIPEVINDDILKDIKKQIKELEIIAKRRYKIEVDTIKQHIKAKLEERKQRTKMILDNIGKIDFKTNEELFKLLRKEIVTLLEKIQLLRLEQKNEKEIEILMEDKRHIEDNLLYRANIKCIKPDGTESEEQEQIAENISWSMQNSLWVEKYLELGGKSIEQLETQPILNSEEYKCDLSGLSQNYIIIDEFINNGEGGDGLEYVICGYPEKKMKTTILNFWQKNGDNDNLVDEYNKIHEEQETTNGDMFMNLFNDYKKPEIDKLNEEIIKKESELKKKESELKHDESKIPLTESELQINKVDDITKLKEDIINLNEKKNKYKISNTGELSKLYVDLRNVVFDYIQKRYSEIYKSNDLDYIYFKNNFEINANVYFQKIVEKYLPKPLTHIKYIFLVFKKNKDETNNDILIPFIFNVKELTREHQPILIQIERLIKYKLSYKFGILKSNEQIKFPLFDNEYKLWYSRYSYGTIFNIETQYNHCMNNISDKAKNYKNSIQLEQLIYINKLDYKPTINSNDNYKSNITFLNKVKMTYSIREHQFYYKFNVLEEYEKNKNSTYDKTDCRKYEVGQPNEFRSDLVFCLYEKKKKENEMKELTILFKNDFKKGKRTFEEWKKNKIKMEKEVENNKIQYGLNTFKTMFSSKNNKDKIKFILMFKTHQQTYTFIYSFNYGKYLKFYKLVIESNISQLLSVIIQELKGNVVSKNFDDIIIKFNDVNKIFRVVSNDVLDEKYLEDIFDNNPFIVNNITQIPKQSIIDVSYYYKTSLLIPTTFCNLKNLYTEIKPYIYTNSIKGYQYITGFKKYIDNLKNNKIVNLDYNTLTFEKKFTNCSARKCEPYEVIINCAYYNIGNSGYDIIENIDNNDNKIILYIVPHNYNHTETFSEIPEYKTKYLGNFLDLDETSLSILNEIKTKYLNNDYVCFLHHTMQLRFYCLHFHIIKKDNYKRNYPKNESGIFIIQDMFIDEVINNLKSNINYYKLLNYNIYKST